ncbi:MAG: SIS domain-containing protein [Gemmatimonadetes bacterium]|jgi:D-sedoheptulose 7-phosphate isomerase|nr:SIS domain-containing protein [Gemmatimonadota bacterium]
MGDAPSHAFLYPFLYEEEANEGAPVLEEVQRSSLQKCREVVELRRRFLEEQEDVLLGAAAAMAERFRAGGRLLTFGCGGSATDALDAAHDFASPPDGRRALPALSLAADVAVITAVANDVGFDKVFLRQLISYGRAGDIALGISTSGNSASLVEGFRQARRQGMLTVGLLGYDGGEAARSGMLDHALVIRADYVPRIQEAQATVYHALRDLVEMML